MLFIEKKDGKTTIEVKGTTADIARELMELIVNISISLKDQLDVKGMIQDEGVWAPISELIEEARGANEQAKESK